MLIVRHLGTPNSDFNGCHWMHDPVLYRSMDPGSIAGPPCKMQTCNVFTCKSF